MSEIDHEDELDAANEIVFRILGDDHPIVQDIRDEKPVLFTDVIIELIGKLDQRLSEIETRKVH